MDQLTRTYISTFLWVTFIITGLHRRIFPAPIPSTVYECVGRLRELPGLAAGRSNALRDAISSHPAAPPTERGLINSITALSGSALILGSWYDEISRPPQRPELEAIGKRLCTTLTRSTVGTGA